MRAEWSKDLPLELLGPLCLCPENLLHLNTRKKKKKIKINQMDKNVIWSEANTFFACLCVFFPRLLLGFLGRFLEVKGSVSFGFPCAHLSTRLRTSPFFCLCLIPRDLRATGRNLAGELTWPQPKPAISPGAASSSPGLPRGSGKTLPVS